MTPPAITVSNVWKRFRLYHERNQSLKATITKGKRAKFDEFWALQDVSFEVPQGSTFAIIGSNGSGKSTLLKCLAGILTPDRGTMSASGRVAALLELGAGFHPELSGRENVALNGAILGMSSREVQNKFVDIVEFAGLEKFIDMPVKNYSSGMTVRLGFSIAINVEPEILIIDEVLAVGDQSFQNRCYEKIEDFRRDGRTIVLVSHGLATVSQMCDQAIWIEKGVTRNIGAANTIVNDYLSFASESESQPETPEIAQRWGSGEVHVKDVALMNSHREPTGIFQSEESITIRIHLENFAIIPDGALTIEIRTLHGVVVWKTTSANENFEYPQRTGLLDIECTVPSLLLLEGTFDVSVGVTNLHGNHDYDHLENAARFTVLKRVTYDSGIVPIHSWWKNI